MIPYEVRYALEDALKIRRRYHTWYSSQRSRTSSDDQESIEQSNESHGAFIDVLQFIQDLFMPEKTPIDQLQSSTPPEEKILETTNLFANLQIEAMAEEETFLPMAKQSSDTAAKPWVAKKARMLIEDKILELYCLYDDANKIRDYLRKKWAEYSSRKIDIKSAALTTQEALELFSEIEESFETKYGTILKHCPEAVVPKFLDIYTHLAVGELAHSNFTKEKYESMTEGEKVASKLRAQSAVEDCAQRAAKSGWRPSGNLSNWVMEPETSALFTMVHKGDDWVLKQACRKSMERADDLAALGDGEGMEDTLRDSVRELLDTLIDVYAGMIFFYQNPRAFIAPYDIITSMWLEPYNCSIRMTLSMQILQDIRAAKSESGQLDILTQASEDYKRLGAGVAMLGRVSAGSQQPSEEEPFLKAQVEKERSWLQGRVPGHIGQAKNKSKKGPRKISELPLRTNPVLAGIVLFGLSYQSHHRRMTHVNEKWFLIPCAHLINWLLVAEGKAGADFQNIWPDLHTALGMIGSKPVWVGSGPPGDLRACRHRMLLAWGLPLMEFYPRMLRGDIPKAEELFSRIKNNQYTSTKLSGEQIEQVLSGKATPADILKKAESGKRAKQPLTIEMGQCTPLLDATQPNLATSALMNAQQSHIRKILLAATATGGPGNTAKAFSSSRRKGREEPDMMSYLDAFSRATRAEMPRLLFPYDQLSVYCCSLSPALFGIAHRRFDLSAEIWSCEALAKFEETTILSADRFGSGAQSVCSLLALATMFGDRTTNRPVERPMLRFIEEKWDKEKGVPPRSSLTESFVEKCKALGFVVPECTAKALSPGGPARQST